MNQVIDDRTRFGPLQEPGSGRPNLAAVADRFREHFAAGYPRGYVQGKTELRDAAMSMLGCSALRAERIVDQMETLGYLHYRGSRHHLDQGRETWAIHVNPSFIS